MCSGERAAARGGEMMDGDTLETALEVLFSPEVIAARVSEMAREIAAAGLVRPLVVPVLTGSFVFSADLLRALHASGMAPEVDFMTLASYRRATRSSGSVEILRDMELDAADRDVLLIDDILDTGRTLAYAKDLIAARGARRILTCVLLDKNIRRAVQMEADFVAFKCPPLFVVGYGMDLANRYRELPYVGRVVGR
jgi:hypoxanthine phosphoribosyltransferase